MHAIDSGLGEGTSGRPLACEREVMPEVGAFRSLAPYSDVLPHGPIDSGETHSQNDVATRCAFERRGDGLEHGLQKGDATSAAKGEPASQQRQLGLFAEIEDDGVANASRLCQEWMRLRACEVVRLLNATPLGPIINDRQLYRHRQRAPWIQGDGNRIDLLKYAAWLATHRCSRKPSKRRIRGREVLTLEELREILHRQNFRCALTGERLTPSNFALDHIVPITDGGEFTAANSQLVLKSVNRAKNTMSERDFIEMCRQVAFHRQSDVSKQTACSDEPQPTPLAGSLPILQGVQL